MFTIGQRVRYSIQQHRMIGTVHYDVVITNGDGAGFVSIRFCDDGKQSRCAVGLLKALDEPERPIPDLQIGMDVRVSVRHAVLQRELTAYQGVIVDVEEFGFFTVRRLDDHSIASVHYIWISIAKNQSR